MAGGSASDAQQASADHATGFFRFARMSADILKSILERHQLVGWDERSETHHWSWMET
jgi:hypothetical protein